MMKVSLETITARSFQSSIESLMSSRTDYLSLIFHLFPGMQCFESLDYPKCAVRRNQLVYFKLKWLTTAGDFICLSQQSLKISEKL